MHISTIIGEKNSKRIKILQKDLKHLISNMKDIETKYEYMCIQYRKHNTFFGYYDISPFCPTDDNLITYISVDENKKIANIHIHDLVSDNIKTVAQTKAWNWQQACRLRWFPDYGGAKKIMFNCFNNGKYTSNVLDIDTGEFVEKSTAFYDINRAGTIGLSTDFARLGVLRPGYGYTCYSYDPNTVKSYDACVEIWDLKKDTRLYFITYEQVLNSLGKKESELYEHSCYINHLCFSPSGENFLFFFVEIINGYHQANMLTYNINTRKLTNVETEMKVSHYMWIDDNTIIATCYDKQYNCRYYNFNIVNGTKECVMKDNLKRDGHPIFLDKNKWISDTYPDGNCYQKLFYIYPKSNQIETILDVYSTPHCYGEKRTDLHPRINATQSLVCIDANPSGKRCLIIIKVKK